MQRREFITFLGWHGSCLAAHRASASELIGCDTSRGSGSGARTSPRLTWNSLRTGLRELGWIEGRNLTIGVFWATGREDMEATAREVLASDPEVIVTQELMAIAMRSSADCKARGLRLQR